MCGVGHTLVLATGLRACCELCPWERLKRTRGCLAGSCPRDSRGTARTKPKDSSGCPADPSSCFEEMHKAVFIPTFGLPQAPFQHDAVSPVSPISPRCQWEPCAH